MRINYKLRCYRFSDELTEKLDQLKKYRIIESKFIRQAIEEKLERDLPKLKVKKDSSCCPF